MEISPKNLILSLKKEEILLIDVREPWEISICTIEPSLKIPLKDLEHELEGLEEIEKKIVFYCHHGIRSLTAVFFAERHQIKALSLRGGIDLWAEIIDPTCPKY